MYNREWERQMRPIRAERRLILLRSLPYGTPTADIETVCRGKLSNANEATFHWRLDGRRPAHLHLGWVFIEVPDTATRDRVMLELSKLRIRNRPVSVSAGSHRARPPRQHQAAPVARLPATTVGISGTTHPAPLPPPPAPTPSSSSATSAVVVCNSNSTASSTLLDETEEEFEIVSEHSTAWDDDTWSSCD